MKDEIKEILDYLKETDDKDIYGYVKDKILAYEEGVKLLDYITNLQRANKNHSKKIIEMGNKITNLQEELEIMVKDDERSQETIIKLSLENERLKEELQQEKKDFKEANDYCFELKVYKSRNEKAIEYIKEHYYEMIFGGDFVVKSDELLNILNGGDE